MKVYLNGERIGLGGSEYLAGDGVDITDGTINVSVPTRPVTKEEYDALTEAEKNADAVYIITDDNGSGGSSAGEVYSTEETRIGTWIDGKPIYRQVFVGENILEGRYSIRISKKPLENIDTVTRFDGVCYSSNSDEVKAISLGWPSVCHLSIDLQNYLCAYVEDQWADGLYTVTAIVEYTKTTD